MSINEDEIELFDHTVQDQITFINNAITEALNGTTTKIITHAKAVASYSLPTAIEKGERCRVVPQDEGSTYSIHITPKE